MRKLSYSKKADNSKRLVVFNTPYDALAATLATMQVQSGGIPIIAPITTPKKLLGTLIRHSSYFLLVDVGPDLLFDPEQLKAIVGELEACVILWPDLTGTQPSESLLSILRDNTSIAYADNWGFADPSFTYTIYDLNKSIELGSVVMSSFKDMRDSLNQTLDSLLNLSWKVTPLVRAAVTKNLAKFPSDHHWEKARTMLQAYKTLLGSRVLNSEAQFPSEVFIKVNNVKLVQAHLADLVKCSSLEPLHLLPEARELWPEDPSYPQAEALANQVVSIPLLTKNPVNVIVDRILEVDHD